MGNYQEWNQYGELIEKGQYEDYPVLEQEMLKKWYRPFKIGKWEYYNNGILTKEEIFDNKGLKINTINK